MKKKSLTKRLVSFITAVGLTLTSTVMLIPASAASKGEQCTTMVEDVQCEGTYAWQEVEEGAKHQLVCSADPAHVDAESLHDAGTQVDTCELCEEQAPATFAVSVAEPDAEEGTLVADVETAAAGDIVTLTVTPTENYEVDVVTVMNGETPVDVTQGEAAENGVVTATFVMPAAAVTVSATFTEKQTEPVVEKYTVTVDTGIENGTVTVEPAEATTEGVAAETEVTLTVTPASENYEIAEVSYTADGGDKQVIEGVDGAYTFEMPEADVTVSATFNDITSNPKFYTVTVNVNDAEMGTATSNAPVDGVEEGTEVTLTANANPGYQFKEWTVVSGGVTVTDNKFEMGTENVVVTAVFEAIPATKYTVTVNVNDAEMGTATSDAAEGGVATGTEVTLTATAADGYQFKEWTVVSGGVTVTDNKFTMATENVVVTAVFEAIPATEYAVTVNVNDAEMGTAKVAKINNEATEATSAEAGDYVVIEAKENDGYEFVQWNVIKGDVSIETAATETPGQYYTGDTYFVMPAEAVEIQAEFKAVEVEAEAGWADNGDGSYTYTSVLGLPGENDEEGTPRDPSTNEDKNYAIDISDLIEDGKTFADIASISADFEVSAGNGAVGGAFAISGIPAEGEESGWVQVQVDSTKTYTIETPYGVYDNEKVQIQVWWANADSALTVKNIKITYKAVEAEKYDITIGAIENGTVKTDVEEAEEGETVTVTVEPAKGYKVDTVSYTYGEDITFDAVEDENGVYTFEMPADDVTVTATFVKEDYDVTVTVNDDVMGTAEANVSTAQMGDIVYLTAESSDEETYEFVEWKVVEGDAKIETVASPTPNMLTDTYFVMPAEDVEVEAIFKEIGSYFIKIGENENGEIDVAETAKAGDEVTFTVTPDDGYEIDQVTYSYNKAEGGVFAEEIKANEDGSYTITMPEADVTISATYTAKDYEITVVTADNGTVKTDVEADEEGKVIANVNELITITVTPDEGYQLVADSLVVTDENEEPVEVTANEDGTYSFTMPASHVTIEAAFEAINYKVTVAETENGTVEADKTTAIIGDTVTFTATPSTDVHYVVKSYEVTYINGEETVTAEVTKGEDGKYTFEMPAADVTITVVFDTFVFELTDGKDTVYCDTWEEIAEAIKDGEYTITVNDAYEFDKKFALPKTAKSLTFTGEGKLTFTGTKLVVPVNTTFDVEIAVSNKTNLIDISVAKDVTLCISENAYTFDEETDRPVQFINKLTGTKTSKLNGVAVVNNIATFGEVNVAFEEAYLEVNGGKATGIAKLGGKFVIIGDKATAAITEVADDAEIILVINGTVIPKVTIDTFGKAVKVDVSDEESVTVGLSSGTTILYTKNPIPTGEDAIVVKNKTANSDELTAYYYAKTKEIKAEVSTALTLTYGEGDSAFEKSYPNFDLLLADITDNTVDYTITVNTDLTLSTKFALPKKAKSITFDGEGVLTFTGTKLAVPYNVTIGEGIVINAVNKKNAFDISVAKNATLVNNGTINGINKLSGTKTSILVGEYSVKNIATFAKVDGNVTVNEGKATNIIELNGGLAIYGAKATAAITTVDPGSEIKLIKVNNVLPKVTVEAIGEKVEDVETITVTVYDSLTDNDGCDLASGTTILYAKKNNDFTDKIVIGNDEDMSAYAYGKEIRAEYGDAVSVDDLNTTENAAHEKDYQNFEAAVAAINAANDATANYEITINKDIAPVKFDLPKAAASVSLVGDDVTINIGKATSITANTDLAINGIEFVTTGKTLTINAKKNLAVNELYGNVTAIKGGAKSTLTWVSENEATTLVDITGFGTVEVRETLTIGKNFNVTKLVLGAEDSATALVVSNVAAKASIKALDATNGGAIEYAEGAKIALAFTGKDADFVVAEDGLTIIGEVANGQAVLATDKVAITKLANGVTPANPAVEYGFVKVGKNICYMGKVLEVKAVKGEEAVGDEVAYALWSEVIAAMSDAEADYVITLLDAYNANGAVKFPKAGTYKSVTITSDEGEKFNFTFTGNLALTAPTVFSDVNISAVKKSADAKYTINAGKNDITISDCGTGMLTAVKGSAKVNLSNVSAGKVSAGTLSLSGAVIAKDGVTTKDLEIAAEGAKLSINQGKKIAVSVNVVLAEAEDAKGLEVTVLDKTTGEAATLKNGEVIATVKGEGYANITLDQTAHEGVSLEYNKGKLVVTGGVESDDDDDDKPTTSCWSESNGVITLNADKAGGIEDGTYPAYKIDLDKLLNGKSYSSVKSLSVDVKVDTGFVMGVMGINDAAGEWQQSNSFEGSGTMTISLNGVQEGQDLQLQIWWANAGSKATFSNITIS